MGDKMRKMSVKEYARLIGKKEKTVYKMIKDDMVVTLKENGKYRIQVDRNLIKVIERAQQALEEAKSILLSIESASEQLIRPSKLVTLGVKSVAKSSQPKKKTPIKQSL